jgi:hypothetical protein
MPIAVAGIPDRRILSSMCFPGSGLHLLQLRIDVYSATRPDLQLPLPLRRSVSHRDGMHPSAEADGRGSASNKGSIDLNIRAGSIR